MSDVSIISANKNYMVVTLMNKLEELAVSSEVISASPDAISKVSANTKVLFLYDESDLSADRATMTYIKDWALEHDAAIFVCGNPTDIDIIGDILPKHLIKGGFPRPINVKNVAEILESFVKNEGSVVKKKILVVDDSGAYLRNVKAWLEDKYQIIPANSGMMAIKYISTNRPDLVLLDYEMPVCDGKQVLEMIRSDSDCSNLPVIFLTSKDDKESVLQVMSLKPAGYLLKTMAPEAIIKTIDDFFDKQKAGV